MMNALWMSAPSALFGGGVPAAEREEIIEQPASPTAPLSCLSLEDDQQEHQSRASKRRSLGRRVTFDEDTKSFDGLAQRTKILDDIIKRFFVLHKETSELDVIYLCNMDVSSIKNLAEDLNDLAQRVEECMDTDKPFTPVLPRGGGMCTKLSSAHLPYIKTLTRVVEASTIRASKLASSSPNVQ